MNNMELLMKLSEKVSMPIIELGSEVALMEDEKVKADYQRITDLVADLSDYLEEN